MKKVELSQIRRFLDRVEKSFPVPLSKKQNLTEFAKKLHEKATVCTVQENGEILSMVAGYTENTVNDLAYISVVATLPTARGQGYAKLLVQEFISIVQKKGLKGVHLYAVKTNIPAVSMYKRLGFVEYIVREELRPQDLHLLYEIKE